MSGDGSGPSGRFVAGMTALVVLGVVLLIGIPLTAYLVSTSGDDDSVIVPSEAALYAPLLGYTFDELPAGELTSARAAIESAPELGGLARTVSGRAAVRETARVAQVLVYELTSRFTDRPTFAEDLRKVVTRSATASEPVTASGEEATYYQRADGTVGALGIKSGVAVIVQGGGPSMTREQVVQLVVGLLGRIP